MDELIYHGNGYSVGVRGFGGILPECCESSAVGLASGFFSLSADLLFVLYDGGFG